MIALFCEDDLLATRVLRVLHDEPLRHENSRAGFVGLVKLARCALVVLPDLCDPDRRRWFRSISEASCSTGWILLTHFEPGNALHLAELDPSVRVLWLFEMEHSLPPVIQEFSQTDLLDMVFELALQASGTSSDLAKAFEQLAKMPHPPRTIGGLGKAAGLTEHRLRYLWTRRQGPVGSLRELLDWVIMAWALRLRTTLRSWAKVAGELRIKEETLRALCLRRTGMTPSALEAMEGRALKEKLLDWWEGRSAG